MSANDIEAAVKKARLLSPRQKQVLRALARGAERKEIAADLEISKGTVDFHCRLVFATLGVSNAREATMIGIKAFNL